MTAPAKTELAMDVLAENLRRAGAIALRGLSAKSPHPITSHLLLTTDRGRLMIAGTDFDFTVKVWCGAKVDSEGSVVVPGKLFTDLIASLPEHPVALTQRGRKLRFEGGRADGEVHCLEAEDFPVLPNPEGAFKFAIPSRTLARAISKVEFAAARDDSRPVLTGVNVKCSPKGIEFAATDGFRLSVFNAPNECPGETSVIIPARALREVERICKESTENVTVTIAEKKAWFELTDLELCVSLIEGTFPNYRQLIPEEKTTVAMVEVEAFSKAARYASIYARGSTGNVRMLLSEGVAVSARGGEMGEGEMAVDAEITGPPNKVAVNCRYLQEALGAFEGKVEMTVNSPSSQVEFRAGEFTHIVMPIFTQWER